ncbi:hypothetical protein DES37_102300 [Mangrovibacter plantisponsor]|uniref:Uncharacterized protein n=1 Tax=Mangrovibacter plantisponsor TaxID=451513 RepID=A0A317Q7L3_9ENTR|nr:hypothetical protein DES37_102300 [Mangrovibacter plantisponsor]
MDHASAVLLPHVESESFYGMEWVLIFRCLRGYYLLVQESPLDGQYYNQPTPTDPPTPADSAHNCISLSHPPTLSGLSVYNTRPPDRNTGMYYSAAPFYPALPCAGPCGTTLMRGSSPFPTDWSRSRYWPWNRRFCATCQCAPPLSCSVQPLA